jgi:hypothetical protein
MAMDLWQGRLHNEVIGTERCWAGSFNRYVISVKDSTFYESEWVVNYLKSAVN